MWHLTRRKNKDNQWLYDISFIISNRFIVGSNQGYVDRRKAVYALRSIYKTKGQVAKGGVRYQDDTLDKPVVFFIYSDGIQEQLNSIKPTKKYVRND